MRTLALLVLCGCAAGNFAAPQRPANIDAEGVQHDQGHFDGALGLRLFRQSWRPHGEPRAVLIIVHGLKDHSARYAEFADRLAQHGYAVHAFDLRGHGSSEGARVYVTSFSEYVQDLQTFADLVREQEGPAKPLFVLGHSMGGAIVTDWVLQQKPQVAGIVLSGAALKVDASGFKQGTVKFLGSVLPTLALFSLDLDHFSRDAEVVEQCKSDPLVDQGAGPVRTAAQLISAIDFIDAHMEDFTLPLLALHGGADVITPPDGSRELARRARSSDKTLKIYDGLYHDLLHEPERAQVMSDIAAWLDERVK
jgi:acylglycerol lipase